MEKAVSAQGVAIVVTAIETIEQLEAIYGQPGEAATIKVAQRITPSYRALIEHSPFAILATCGEEGLDCSPRGDLPGFVRVYDDLTLIVPDRRGNNRIDSLRNLIRDPRAALLFLIPGSGTTLRVNGRALVSADPELLASFGVEGKTPRSVIVMTVERNLLSVRARHHPFAPLGSGQARRPQELADARRNPRGDEQEPRRRRRI